MEKTREQFLEEVNADLKEPIDAVIRVIGKYHCAFALKFETKGNKIIAKISVDNDIINALLAKERQKHIVNG
jgi:hypothetical protein